MKLTAKKITTLLRQQGYKLTPQRRAVIRTVASSDDHLTPTALHEKLRREYPAIGLVTVYRTLEIMARLGLVCQVHAGGCRSYTISARERHHHLICSGCGRVVDFVGYNLDELKQRLSRETGFEIGDYLLEFVGLCPQCRGKR